MGIGVVELEIVEIEKTKKVSKKSLFPRIF